MKLAVSNIAWTNEEEADVAQLLHDLGVTCIELAPTKRWQDPTTQASVEELVKYKKFWSDHGIEVVAFQSMLFNRPDLQIFESEELRAETLKYFERFIKLAPPLGAQVMVFGSPKNRRRGDIAPSEAQTIAQPFFAQLGEAAELEQVTFCIEPNPVAYACDFVTTAQEGIDFVKAVNQPGFGLHLDIAGMTLAGDDVVASIHTAGAMIQHFHISAPYLEPVAGRDDVAYAAAAKALQDIDYKRYVSIEMKPGAAGENLDRVATAVRFVQKTFSV